MDGIHDLGGKHGFGSVDTTEHPVFEHRWHAGVFAAINALLRAGVADNVDHFRHAVERIDPVAYLTHGYYGRWLGAAENLLVESGRLTQDQINKLAKAMGADAHELIAARPSATPDTFQAHPPINTARRAIAERPRFVPGDLVRCRDTPSSGHTRLPAYVRGKQGKIVALHGGWALPDTHAHGELDSADYLYTVEFSAAQLWAAETADSVCVDLFESYLNKSLVQT